MKKEIKKGKDRAKEKDMGMERQGRVVVGNITALTPDREDGYDSIILIFEENKQCKRLKLKG